MCPIAFLNFCAKINNTLTNTEVKKITIITLIIHLGKNTSLEHSYSYSSFFLIIQTFIKEKKLGNNIRRTINPANINNTSREVGLITRKGPSKTTSQLSRSMSFTIIVSTNPTKYTTQKALTNF